MDWAFQNVDIVGDLSIRKMTPEDFERIAVAINDPQGYFAKSFGIDTPEKIVSMLATNYEAHLAGRCNPFVFFVGDDIVGITRFFRFDNKRLSLEIGGTWIAPKWRRTFVNTKAKYLLMDLAFESFGAERIEYVVNSSNLTSQMAVLRIGAKKEGILRRTYIGPDGQPSDGILYSVISSEWPGIKKNLIRLLNKQALDGDRLPTVWDGRRVRLRPYALGDAQALLESFQRNRSSIERSFPSAAKVYTLEDARTYIAEIAHRFADESALFLGIWDRSNAASLIGQVQIKNLDWNLKSAELGYFIDCEMRRQGYATEVLKLIVDELMSRQAFSRLAVRILPDNRGSLELAKTLGFRQEGIMRSALRTGTGELTDVLLLSLTN